jgi:hypothetical protein
MKYCFNIGRLAVKGLHIIIEIICGNEARELIME